MSSTPMIRIPDETSRVKALTAATGVLHPDTIAKGEDCPICLEPLAPTKGHAQEQAQIACDPAIKTKICGHTAHFSCLLRWTEQHSSCVYCREEMFQEMRWEWCYVAPDQGGERGFCVSMEEWNERVRNCRSEEEERWVKRFKSTWVEVRYRY